MLKYSRETLLTLYSSNLDTSFINTQINNLSKIEKSELLTTPPNPNQICKLIIRNTEKIIPQKSWEGKKHSNAILIFLNRIDVNDHVNVFNKPNDNWNLAIIQFIKNKNSNNIKIIIPEICQILFDKTINEKESFISLSSKIALYSSNINYKIFNIAIGEIFFNSLMKLCIEKYNSKIDETHQFVEKHKRIYYGNLVFMGYLFNNGIIESCVIAKMIPKLFNDVNNVDNIKYGLHVFYIVKDKLDLNIYQYYKNKIINLEYKKDKIRILCLITDKYKNFVRD
jgi:hypothetical protein